MQEILELSSELGGDDALVGEAHQKFLHATNLLTHFDAIDPSDHKRPHWERSFAEVQANLEAVAETLESNFIPRATLRAAKAAKQIDAPKDD